MVQPYYFKRQLQIQRQKNLSQSDFFYIHSLECDVYTVKTDLINTCDTQEIKFSTATRAENFSKQNKCQIESFPKKIKVVKIV